MFVSMILTCAMILSMTAMAFADEFDTPTGIEGETLEESFDTKLSQEESYENESFTEDTVPLESTDESKAEESEPIETESTAEKEETDAGIALMSVEDGRITPDMSQEEIQAVFDAKDEVTFAAGAYKGISVTINKAVTIRAAGPLEFTGNGKSAEGQSHYPFLVGNGAAVTFDNITLQSSNYDGFMKVSGGTVSLNGGSFNVTGLGHGCVFFSGGAASTLNIQDAVYSSNGNSGDSMVSYANGEVAINFINSQTDLSNNINSGAGHGIWNQGGKMSIEISGGTFNASGNTWAGITLINRWKDFNGYDYGYSEDSLVIKNGSQVTMSDNGTYGFNNGNLTITDSAFTAENNAARDNIACSNLEAVNSTINVNGAKGTGYGGKYWVFGNGLDVGGNQIYIDGTTINAAGNCRSGIYLGYAVGDFSEIGEAQALAVIKNSQINVSGNGKSGLDIVNAADIDATTINASSNELAGIHFNNGSCTVTEFDLNSQAFYDPYNSSDPNGTSVLNNVTVNLSGNTTGIVLSRELNANDSVIVNTGNSSQGIKYETGETAVYKENGNTIAAISSTGAEIEGDNGNQLTLIEAASLQSIRDNMTGTYELNGVKADDESYAHR